MRKAPYCSHTNRKQERAMKSSQIERHLKNTDISIRWARVTLSYTGMPSYREGVVMTYADAFRDAMYAQARYMRTAPRVSRSCDQSFDAWKAKCDQRTQYRNAFKYEISFV
jgi:hypothetical protein